MKSVLGVLVVFFYRLTKSVVEIELVAGGTGGVNIVNYR